MNISSKEIIFLTIFIVFGRIISDLKYKYKDLFPLPTYKFRILKTNSITKITKYLYTSLYNNNALYMVFKIPYNNCIYYHHNELLFTKSVFTFIIIFLLQYLDNSYINIFKYDNNILFIIDYCYTVILINNLGITKIDKSHNELSVINFKNYSNSIKNKHKNNNTNNNTNNTNHNNNELTLEESINTYTLCWIKYMKNRFTFIFILYLCYFSKYKHYSNTIIIDKYNAKLIQNISHIINSCNQINKKGISNVIEISDKYLCINFKYINHIIMDNQYILKYLNKNIVMYNNFNYQTNIIVRNILSYFETEYNTHKNKHTDIINKKGFFLNIATVPYTGELINDTFI